MREIPLTQGQVALVDDAVVVLLDRVVVDDEFPNDLIDATMERLHASMVEGDRRWMDAMVATTDGDTPC